MRARRSARSSSTRSIGRIGRGVHEAPRPNGVGAQRQRNAIAGLAAAALMLSSGTGAVIAATSLGGSHGHGDSLSTNAQRTRLAKQVSTT